MLLGPPAWAHDVPGYGTVSFPTSCAAAVQANFDIAFARLHDFDLPEAAFRRIAETDPGCGIAWWGAAMAVRGNPLAAPPPRQALEAGRASIAKALAAEPKTPVEQGLIAALAVYYRDPAEGHGARTQAYEAAMRDLAARFPDDPEVQSVAALAILEAVDLTDRSYRRQREAGAMLERVLAAHPDHPGALHYLIHAYDYPPLAGEALAAARRYGDVAAKGMHAQHMPSHVYSMLGLWPDSIAANRAAAAVMAEGRPLSTVEADVADPHGMDFIAYAELQLGRDAEVAAILGAARPSEERTLVAARDAIERGDWPAAARLAGATGSPIESVTVRFARALGLARSGDPAAARAELDALRALRAPVLESGGGYWAGLVDVYAAAAEAWVLRAEGNDDAAIESMREAADLDDGREKHILLENRLVPMRELAGALLLAAGRPAEALDAYRTSLGSVPNRFNGFLGAARAAWALGRVDEAKDFYAKAAALTADAAPGRPDIAEARRFARP